MLRAETEKVRTAPKEGANRDEEARTEAIGARRRGRCEERSLAAEFMVNKGKGTVHVEGRNKDD